MKIHLNQIPTGGLHLEGQEQTDILQLEDPNIRPIEPVSYSLDVGISGTGLFATGRLWTDVEMECVSCLKRFVYPLEVNNFAAQVELTGPEVVDLTPAMREDILLVLPAHPRCDWDRKTVCLRPRITPKTVDNTTKAPNAWDVLDELRLKRKS
jgi:uncharacterized metal-binding protein YceD (DUF177 family)